MTIDKVYDLIRQLAKSIRYQNLYTNVKELHIKLFENECNLTPIQEYFLNFLNFYSSINMDIVLGDVDKLVLDNEIYEDSYTIYKRKKRMKREPLKTNPKEKATGKNIQWLFKSPSKKVNT